MPGSDPFENVLWALGTRRKSEQPLTEVPLAMIFASSIWPLHGSTRISARAATWQPPERLRTETTVLPLLLVLMSNEHPLTGQQTPARHAIDS
ncbi:hypothetical protein VTO42DRAFT_4483 [Malbranchea cinnamomea]